MIKSNKRYVNNKMQNQRHETKNFALQTFNVSWHIISFFVTFIYRIRIIVCFVFDIVFIIVRMIFQNNKMFNQRFNDEQIIEIDQIENISFFFKRVALNLFARETLFTYIFWQIFFKIQTTNHYFWSQFS